MCAGAIALCITALPDRLSTVIAQPVTAGAGDPIEVTYIKARHDPSIGLVRINTWQETKTADPPVLPYIWVACSQRGTVVRIATADYHDPVRPIGQQEVHVGDILGQYWIPGTPSVLFGTSDAGGRRLG